MNYINDNTLYGYWNDGTFLYHHGILGMRWGKQNGPPYPLDAEDHSASEKKAGWRKSLKENREIKKQKTRADIDSVKKQLKKNNRSLSDYEAEQSAKNIINISNAGRALLAAGLLAGGAVAVYATLHKDPYGDDFTIPSGGEIFRVQGKEHPDLPDGFFYATPDTHDAKVYKGAWGEEQTIFGGTGEYKNALTIGVNKDMKVAGMTAAQKAYDSLKNTPEFRQYQDVKQFLRDAPMDKLHPGPFSAFQRELAKQGYNGVIDYNDKYGQGFKVKAPVILFNDKKQNSSEYNIKTIESLDRSKVEKYKLIANAHLLKAAMMPTTPEQVTNLAINAAPVLAAYGITEAIRSNAVKNDKARNKIKK